MRRSRAITKKHVFYAFFHVQPKHQNDAIFVNIEGFSAMIEQAELRIIPMGPHGPPNAKGTA